MNRIPLLLDNRIRLRVSDLDPETLTALQREFTHVNPDKAKLEKQAEGAKYNKTNPGLRYALAKKAAQEPATDPTWALTSEELSLPRGGQDRVEAILEENGYLVSVDDQRTSGTLPRPNARLDLKLRPFQTGIVHAAMRAEQGIARSPTGSGKTEALIGALVEANLPSLIIVSEGGLFDQWVRRLRGGLGLRSDQVGMIGGGKFEPRAVTVGMQQSLVRCVDKIAPLFGFVGCDEVQLFAAKTFRDVVDRMPARYRVGVSADERRKDRKEYLLYDTIGPLIANVREDVLLDSGIILEVEVRLVPTTFTRQWWHDLDPRVRGLQMDRLLAEMGEDEIRNKLIADIATWLSREEDEQVLVMAHHVDHCRRLLALIEQTQLAAQRYSSAGLLVGEDKTAYVRSMAGMMQGSVRIGVGTYKKMGIGIDMKRLSRGVAATPVHLNRFFMKQLRGRFCRSADGKEDSVLYVLWDHEIFGFSPVENFRRWAKRVVVRDGGAWVEAREYLKRVRGGV